MEKALLMIDELGQPQPPKDGQIDSSQLQLKINMILA
jgi:hypothetical protein